jgi:hypothetical protein
VRAKCLVGAPRGRRRCRSDEMICALSALAERVPSGHSGRVVDQAVWSVVGVAGLDLLMARRPPMSHWAFGWARLGFEVCRPSQANLVLVNPRGRRQATPWR